MAIALFDSPGKADRRRAADSARDARAAFHFVADRIAERGQRSANDLARGEAGIVSVAGQKVAAFRGDDGALRAVSTRCTHLGCQVRWNAAERTWDCPCHGSRFGVEGEVLNGPRCGRCRAAPSRERHRDIA